MYTIRRTVLVFVLAAAALGAHADVTYTLISSEFGTVTATSPTFVSSTTTTTFTGSQVSGTDLGGETVASLELEPLSGASSNYFLAFATFTDGTGFGDDFPKSLLTSDGSQTYPSVFDTETFTTVGANPTPEPSALAALGVGAVAVLRRRKRA